MSTPSRPHFVSTEPFDPYAVDALTPTQNRYYQASQWQLMWWRFRRHRPAVIAGVVLLLLYASALVSETDDGGAARFAR